MTIPIKERRLARPVQDHPTRCPARLDRHPKSTKYLERHSVQSCSTLTLGCSHHIPARRLDGRGTKANRPAHPYLITRQAKYTSISEIICINKNRKQITYESNKTICTFFYEHCFILHLTRFICIFTTF